MPRAALLSLHARVESCHLRSLQDPSLLQLWGPRYNVYAVPAEDLAVFSLGRLPTAAQARSRAAKTSESLRLLLDGQTLPFGQAGKLLGVHPNSLRYAAPTGTVLLHWDGARQPTIWCVSSPQMNHLQARLELARRYLHIFGPATAPSFARWAGLTVLEANDVFRNLGKELKDVHTPAGDRSLLASDEPLLFSKASMSETIRLLPSGDAYFLAWDEDRTILVPDRAHRSALWTSRVWPGALLFRGELAGTWRRSAQSITITAWKRLSRIDKDAVEVEVQLMPVAVAGRSIQTRWE